MTTNRTRLVEIMELHALSKEDVGRITKASLPTVDSWLRPETSKAARNMPDNALTVLEYSAGEDVLFDLGEIADRLGNTIKSAADTLRRSVDLLRNVIADPVAAAKIAAVQSEENAYALFDFAGIYFLCLTNWILLPCKGRDGRSFKAALRTDFIEDSAGGWKLNNEVTRMGEVIEDMKQRAEIGHLASKAAEIARLESLLDECDDEKSFNDLTSTLRLLRQSLERRQASGPRA